MLWRRGRACFVSWGTINVVEASAFARRASSWIAVCRGVIGRSMLMGGGFGEVRDEDQTQILLSMKRKGSLLKTMGDSIVYCEE